jgi:hypothetical protein
LLDCFLDRRNALIICTLRCMDGAEQIKWPGRY